MGYVSIEAFQGTWLTKEKRGYGKEDGDNMHVLYVVQTPKNAGVISLRKAVFGNVILVISIEETEREASCEQMCFISPGSFKKARIDHEIKIGLCSQHIVAFKQSVDMRSRFNLFRLRKNHSCSSENSFISIAQKVQCTEEKKKNYRGGKEGFIYPPASKVPVLSDEILRFWNLICRNQY